MSENGKKLYQFLRPLLSFLFKIVFRPEIINKENINKGNILAGNHISNFDCIFLISCTKRQIHFLAKKELFIGIKKIIFNHLGLIPVDRSKKNPEALKKSYEYLNNNKLVCVFPEGTTEKGRGVMPFKIGSVKMAKETDKKIIPFVITGKYKIFKKRIKIEFLEPISIKESLEIENDKLQSLIKKKVGM